MFVEWSYSKCHHLNSGKMRSVAQQMWKKFINDYSAYIEKYNIATRVFYAKLYSGCNNQFSSLFMGITITGLVFILFNFCKWSFGFHLNTSTVMLIAITFHSLKELKTIIFNENIKLKADLAGFNIIVFESRENWKFHNYPHWHSSQLINFTFITNCNHFLIQIDFLVEINKQTIAKVLVHLWRYELKILRILDLR